MTSSCNRKILKPPFDTPHQISEGSKDLSYHICVTSKYFCHTNKYNDIGWLLLVSLDKVDNKKRMSSEIQIPTTILE